MNIRLVARIDATLANGKVRQITEEYELYMTPTTVSYEIAKSEDKLGAYLGWLRRSMVPREELVYSLSDSFNPTGYETVDDYPEAERELRGWLKEHEEEGWTIEWLVM